MGHISCGIVYHLETNNCKRIRHSPLRHLGSIRVFIVTEVRTEVSEVCQGSRTGERGAAGGTADIEVTVRLHQGT